MQGRIRDRISYANVVSTLALFLALGGVSYAAIKLPANSVGGTQIKRNAVTAAKVKDRSLVAKDFKAGELPAGARGAQGAQGVPGANGAPGQPGADGAPGTAKAYAYVDPASCTSGCAISKAKGVTSATRPSDGLYCIAVTGLSPTSSLAMAGVDAKRSDTPYGNASASVFSSNDGECPAGQFVVSTQRIPDTAPVGGGFANTDAQDANDVAFWFAVP